MNWRIPANEVLIRHQIIWLPLTNWAFSLLMKKIGLFCRMVMCIRPLIKMLRDELHLLHIFWAVWTSDSQRWKAACVGTQHLHAGRHARPDVPPPSTARRSQNNFFFSYHLSPRCGCILYFLALHWYCSRTSKKKREWGWTKNKLLLTPKEHWRSLSSRAANANVTHAGETWRDSNVCYAMWRLPRLTRW